MTELIQLMQENLLLTTVIWFSLGIVGYVIFRYQVPEFYTKMPWYKHLITLVFYVWMGPLIFILSLFRGFIQLLINKL